MRSVLGLALLIAVMVSLGPSLTTRGSASALFTDTSTIGSNTITSDTLNPPTSVSATTGSSISLSWTATSDTYASGHRLLRGAAAGGPYSQIAEITPRTTTTYIDSPAAGTYYYVVRAFMQNWESSNSNEVSATVTTTTNTGYRSCTANTAVTTSSGDNNGYQLNPANACANDGAFAEDTNSGTSAPDTCASSSKDRHLFYDYGFTIPAGSTIDGIEVRLDAWVDGTSQGPFMCVELSWNAGAAWTASKSTPTLTTTEATYALGSASDTWGSVWSASNLSNGNFRVRVIDVSGFSNRDFHLDWVAVQVTYTPP